MRGSIFPWRGGNRFELLLDGQVFFPRMLAAIEAAERQVEIELYLVEDGQCSERLTDALCRACARGVVVRGLFDAYGAAGLGASLRARLQAAGVQLRWYNPVRWRRGIRNFHRDHRKLLVVDSRLAYVGGTGSTDEFWLPDAPLSPWHEAMVEIEGPLVGDWQQLFEHQWRARFSWRPSHQPAPLTLPECPPVGIGLGRVAYADAAQHRDILLSLLRALRGAKQRVWLATPYFLPTWKIRRALRRAAARGVEVRLLLAGRNTDHPPVRFAGQRYYPKLLKAGVRIFEYQPRFLHLKMVLVDDWVSVGSCNFDHWNLRFNLDANVEALDPAFTRAVAASFIEDFGASREITLEDWRQRPWWRRAQQRLWGWLDRLAVNLLDRWR
ncbi:phosphatidylserine/phosphatidylglycerophosphate/cardiolipin synthase family protein [Pseudomonas berkeleyensis]|uniref:Phosphatidylserine/phosphatidylglycerophosphate/ cardiolipin synthase family protein n=1 Tax=Pseudomonas berkeleyensis TaxID=2726956 RepID=A0A7G5DSK2_9PSED|nr:phosphatidylserine/phosphatidylglycerophosphate/cardiolipin synthase family protein [Pseudomonas berkeleyensis]QMV64727.1 phosphatidylserine/phosphatidylglycerophosphate/cardiolipin synthase family protein [Pseudomonas berkeleyensis]WSO40195.1 phosphatidylserine/phosphatidylglycerophosphate/cardiolipin synthase family protein [Pseudomonas berkeleyensis]